MHAGSAQSMRPLPSSSMPLWQSSILPVLIRADGGVDVPLFAGLGGLEDELVVARRLIAPRHGVLRAIGRVVAAQLIGVARQPRRRQLHETDHVIAGLIPLQLDAGGLLERRFLAHGGGRVGQVDDLQIIRPAAGGQDGVDLGGRHFRRLRQRQVPQALRQPAARASRPTGRAGASLPPRGAPPRRCRRRRPSGPKPTPAIRRSVGGWSSRRASAPDGPRLASAAPPSPTPGRSALLRASHSR